LNISDKILKGSSWVFMGKILSQAADLIKVVILARILTPRDFGLFGLVMIAIATLDVLTQTGFNAALIHKKSKIDKYANTVWSISIMRSISISILLFFLANEISVFFNEPDSKLLLQVICISIVFQGFLNPFVVNFQKELDFKKQFIYDTLSVLISLVVAVVLAIVLRSVWALIFANIAQWSIRLALSFLLTKKRLKFEINFKYTKELFHYGKWVVIQTIFIFIWQQSDKIFIGKILSVEDLGVYQIAYRIALLPVIQISLVSNFILFPAYSKLYDQKDKIKSLFLKSTELIMILGIPILCFFIINSGFIISFLFGDQWLGAVVPLMILSVFTFLKLVGDTSTSLFLGLGIPKMESYRNIIQVVVLFLIIVPLTQSYQLIGVCLALTIAAMTTLYFWIKAINKIEATASEVLSCFKVGAVLGLIILLSFMLFEKFLFFENNLFSFICGLILSMSLTALWLYKNKDKNSSSVLNMLMGKAIKSIKNYL